MSRLPLFPLHAVLFPGGLLPLRIFEPRYVDMIGRCLRADAAFGVVLIRSGGETGPLGDVAAVGTSARIVDFQPLEDGLLGILCRGERRFRLQRRATQPDGLHVGEIEWLPEPEAAGPQTAPQPLVRLLQQMPTARAAAARDPDARCDDAGWVSWRCAELLPFDAATRQRLLETDAPVERLRQIMSLLDIGAE